MADTAEAVGAPLAASFAEELAVQVGTVAAGWLTWSVVGVLPWVETAAVAVAAAAALELVALELVALELVALELVALELVALELVALGLAVLELACILVQAGLLREFVGEDILAVLVYTAEGEQANWDRIVP